MNKFNLTSTLRYAWRTRRVWWFSSLARTKARFARTTIGGFWLGLSNLLSIAALASIYGVVLKVDNFNSYIIYLGCGLVCWNSISTSFSSAPNLFLSKSNQVLNTNTNYIFYTLEEWAFNLQDFAQSLILVLFGLSFFQNNLFFNLFTSGLLPLFNLLMFLYWFPVFISIAGIRYKDLYQLIPVIIQLVFLLSPFLYEKETLGSLAWTADLNPLYQMVAPLRDALIYGNTSMGKFILLLIFNIVGTYISLLKLDRIKKTLPYLL
tara:strand:+ start:4534 stop:5325 length:792 start_codon:yes stop_codon:yes gene_type:complete